MINNGRLDLAVAAPGRRAFSLAFAGVMGGGGAMLVAFALVILLTFPARGAASSFRLVLLVPAMMGMLGIGVAGYRVLVALRTATWLEGTTVYRRGGLVTRAVDLSTAYISAGTSTRGKNMGRTMTGFGTKQVVAVWQVPTLEVLDASTGRTVTIQLYRHDGGKLPPYALRALAAAMTYRRGWDGADREVHQLAQRLLALADRPVL